MQNGGARERTNLSKLSIDPPHLLDLWLCPSEGTSILYQYLCQCSDKADACKMAKDTPLVYPKPGLAHQRAFYLEQNNDRAPVVLKCAHVLFNVNK